MTAQTHSDEPGFADLGAETHATEHEPDPQPVPAAVPEPSAPDALATTSTDPPIHEPRPTHQPRPAHEPPSAYEPPPAHQPLPADDPPPPTAEPPTPALVELLDDTSPDDPAATTPAEELPRQRRPRRAVTPRGVVLASLTSLGLCATIALVAEGLHTHPAAPAASQAFALSLPAPHQSPAQSAAATDPARLRVPAIDLDVPISARADHAHATWLRTVTPGAAGTAVIAAHAGTRRAPAPFHALADLAEKDTITLERADGTTLTFTVDGLHTAHNLKSCDAAGLATVGQPATGKAAAPELALVACGTTYDEHHHRYRHNLVVTAHLTGPAAH